MINQKQHTSAFIKLVDTIKAEIKELAVAGLNKKINSQQLFYLICRGSSCIRSVSVRVVYTSHLPQVSQHRAL